MRGESAAFMMMNHNKRIALDCKNGKTRDVLKRLVASAGVLIENYRHDTLSKLGLGYDALRKVNPGLIYCAGYSTAEIDALVAAGAVSDPAVAA